MMHSGKVMALSLWLIINAHLVRPEIFYQSQCPSVSQLRTRALKYHVISTKAADSLDHCAALCSDNSLCYSLNFYDKNRRCELNDKTAFMNPEHLVHELEGSYLDIQRPYKDCSDLYCEAEKICQMKGPERLHCEACNLPHGMENGKILNSQITASSVWDGQGYLQPWQARLHHPTAFWAALAMQPGEWLQIDLLKQEAVTKIATQGRPNQYLKWVKSYKISFGQDTNDWEFYRESGVEKVFPGNFDSDTVVSHTLANKIRARHIRFVVLTWESHICMRVELYGCDVENKE